MAVTKELDGCHGIWHPWFCEVPSRGAGTEDEGLFQPRQMGGADICQQEGHGRCESTKKLIKKSGEPFLQSVGFFRDWGHLYRQHSRQPVGSGWDG